MKIAFLADFHLGFSYNLEIRENVFSAAKEAIERASELADLIVICGDIFDTRAPRTEIFAKGMEILSHVILGKSSKVKLVFSNKRIPKICSGLLKKIPILAIHGNHERKARGEINPIKALEIAGLVIYLNNNTLIFEKDGEKVAIHGMSNVPERYAKEDLNKWNPTYQKNCFNILVLHQSIYPYIFSPLEPPSLSLKNLPDKFDLIVDGHIHQSILDKVGKSLFLIPGSTAVVQFDKKEAQKMKGFYIFDTLRKEYKFIELETPKQFFFEEIEIRDELPFREQIENKIKGILEKAKGKPIIKIRIRGREVGIIDQDLKLLEKEYAERANLILVKEVESPEITEKIEFLRNLRERKMSIEEMGINLLRENLKKFNFSLMHPERLFNLLEKDVEEVVQILIGEQLTLDRWKSDN